MEYKKFENSESWAKKETTRDKVIDFIDSIFDEIYSDYKPSFGFEVGMTKEATGYAAASTKFRKIVIDNLQGGRKEE